ncbi:hypothetical protein H8R18_06820 [Nanchangia anserum]|uniref:hypothetical protein n=1 Tax=Nanchangia anserum TaxID=2692125 RepID=UPI0018847CB4|nr:hypothetical protein [Nanchangia anserum]QOX81466.1 hypothetical protein H8R18_06820 [Nanchangia anserum]
MNEGVDASGGGQRRRQARREVLDSAHDLPAAPRDDGDSGHRPRRRPCPDRQRGRGDDHGQQTDLHDAATNREDPGEPGVLYAHAILRLGERG